MIKGRQTGFQLALSFACKIEGLTILNQSFQSEGCRGEPRVRPSAILDQFLENQSI